jgi:Ca-activated chloride channel homolog
LPGEARKADRLYEKGRYDEALESYDRALMLKPDEPAVLYNRAAALYRKGDFAGAVKAFLNSLAMGDERLEERAVYNAGNSEFRSGGAKEQSGPEDALKHYRKAAQYYKRAMEIDAADVDAKHNYEFTLKKIEEMEKRQQEKKQDQQQDQQQQQQQDKQDQQQQQQQQDKQDKQDQQQQQQDKQDQQQKEEQEQQDQTEREQQRQEEEQQQQDRREAQGQKEQEPQPGEGDQEMPAGVEPGSAPGELTRTEAEMLLRNQEEEEKRMRAEQRKADRSRRPPVLKDW